MLRILSDIDSSITIERAKEHTWDQIFSALRDIAPKPFERTAKTEFVAFLFVVGATLSVVLISFLLAKVAVALF